MRCQITLGCLTPVASCWVEVAMPRAGTGWNVGGHEGARCGFGPWVRRSMGRVIRREPFVAGTHGPLPLSEKPLRERNDSVGEDPQGVLSLSRRDCEGRIEPASDGEESRSALGLGLSQKDVCEGGQPEGALERAR